MKNRIAKCLLVAVTLIGCLPMTFSHSGRIDFTEYQSVYVEPIDVSGDTIPRPADEGTQRILVTALTTDSGFATATLDAAVTTDTILTVKLRVEELRDFETNELSYEAVAEFTLKTRGGSVIVTGSVSDSSDGESAAQENALDEVAHFFLRPYRI